MNKAVIEILEVNKAIETLEAAAKVIQSLAEGSPAFAAGYAHAAIEVALKDLAEVQLEQVDLEPATTVSNNIYFSGELTAEELEVIANNRTMRNQPRPFA